VIKVAAAADPGTLFGRVRPSVKLVVTATDNPGPTHALDSSGQLVLADGFIEGTPDAIPTTTIDRSVCNAGFIPVLFSRDGTVLDAGREQRLFSAEQRAALALRDGGCRWPDCHRPPSYSEAHHINGWNAGGLTDLDDGILLCARDHLRLHNDGWEITRIGTGTGMDYWLIPPPAADATRTPIRLADTSPLKPRSPLRQGS